MSRPISRWDWLIVGAGFTGAVLAERIATQLDQTLERLAQAGEHRERLEVAIQLVDLLRAQTTASAEPEDGDKNDSYLDWNGALDGLSRSDLALLLRTVELVVQAQTFSRERLQFALRISQDSAVQMTRSLELMGVVAAGEPNAQRRVLVSVRTLPVLLAKLLSSGEYEHSFQSPQEQRVAS